MASASKFVDVSMTGDKELQKALRMLQSVPLQKRTVQAALRVAQQEVTLPRAKANAPRRTGKLASKLRIRVERFKKGKRRGRFGVVVQTGTRKQMGIGESSKWYYPAHVELGTSRMRARPFLRPALYNNQSSLLRVFRKTAWKLLRGEIVRMGRRRVRLSSTTGKVESV